MAIELSGPHDSKVLGSCSACDFPHTKNPTTGEVNPGKVFKLRLQTSSDHAQEFRLCKGCLWKLRSQMKGVIR